MTHSISETPVLVPETFQNLCMILDKSCLPCEPPFPHLNNQSCVSGVVAKAGGHFRELFKNRFSESKILTLQVLEEVQETIFLRSSLSDSAN